MLMAKRRTSGTPSRRSCIRRNRRRHRREEPQTRRRGTSPPSERGEARGRRRRTRPDEPQKREKRRDSSLGSDPHEGDLRMRIACAARPGRRKSGTAPTPSPTRSENRVILNDARAGLDLYPRSQPMCPAARRTGPAVRCRQTDDAATIASSGTTSNNRKSFKKKQETCDERAHRRAASVRERARSQSGERLRGRTIDAAIGAGEQQAREREKTGPRPGTPRTTCSVRRSRGCGGHVEKSPNRHCHHPTSAPTSATPTSTITRLSRVSRHARSHEDMGTMRRRSSLVAGSSPLDSKEDHADARVRSE